MIRPAKTEDAAAMARLHSKYLFAGAGQSEGRVAMLALWYTYVVSCDDAFCFVHSSANEEIDGFIVMFIGRSRSLRHLVCQYPIDFFVRALTLTIQSPADTLVMVKEYVLENVSFKRTRISARLEDQQSNGLVEIQLRPIVVAEAQQGSGLAGVLLATAEQELVRRGKSEYYLVVFKDNEQAVRFYLKNGFVVAQDAGTRWRMNKHLVPLTAPVECVPEKRCPLCKAVSDGKPVFTSSYSLLQLKSLDLAWHQCARCRTYFVADIPDQKLISKHLETVGYGKEEASDRIHRQKAPLYRLILEEISWLKSPNKTVLDFGCAFGSFMELAEKSGFTGYGIDINPVAIEFLRNKRLRAVLGNDVGAARKFGIRFSAIVMNDVVYYLRDLLQSFKTSYDLLETGGVLVLRLPNKRTWLAASLRMPFLRQRAIRSCCYDHFHVADIAAYESCLRNAGFSIGRVRLNVRSSDISDLTWSGRSAYKIAYFLNLLSVGRLKLSPGILLVAVKTA